MYVMYSHVYTVGPLYKGNTVLAVIYTGVAVVEGLFLVQTLHLGPVYLAVISQLAVLQGWPLGEVPLYTVCF